MSNLAEIVGNAKARDIKKVNPTLVDLIQRAAAHVPDYKVEIFSGFRPGDSRQHGKGNALDVRLIDKASGKEVPNYQNAGAFRTYEKFAQAVKAEQELQHPESPGLRWGGYFSGKKGKYGATDLMHFDMAGDHIPMAGGSWEEGLTPKQKRLFPGAESQGMGASFGAPREKSANYAKSAVANAPEKARFMSRLQDSLGIGKEAASAITGNLVMESGGWNPGREWMDVGKPSGGLASWRAERLDALKAFGGKNWKNQDVQADFIAHELKNKPEYAKTYAAMKAGGTVPVLTRAWMEGFERPAKKAAADSIALRTQHAQDAMRILGGEGRDTLRGGTSAPKAPDLNALITEVRKARGTKAPSAEAAVEPDLNALIAEVRKARGTKAPEAARNEIARNEADAMAGIGAPNSAGVSRGTNPESDAARDEALSWIDKGKGAFGVPMPKEAGGSFVGGMLNRLGQQVVGAHQMGREFFGNEHDPRIDALGERLKERARNAGAAAKIGDAAISAGEFLALPAGRLLESAGPAARILESAAQNAAAGAGFSALVPKDSGAQRAGEAVLGAGISGAFSAIPAATSAVRGTGKFIRDLFSEGAAGADYLRRMVKAGEIDPAHLGDMQAKLAAARQIPLPKSSLGEELAGPGKPGRYAGIPEAKPTLGMAVPNNVAASKIERLGRIQAKDDFIARGTENQIAGYRALKSEAITPQEFIEQKRALGESLNPLQQEAFDAARKNLSTAESAKLADYLENSLETRSNPDVQIVRNILGHNRATEEMPLAPEDLRAAQDQIGKKLGSKALADSEANAVKNEYRYAQKAKEALDADLNASSGGKWDEWRKSYREGVAPIQSRGTLGDMIEGIDKKGYSLADTGERSFTAPGIRGLKNAETFTDLGSQKGIDILQPHHRRLVDDLERLAEDQARAMSPGQALGGSQTAPLLLEQLRKIPLPKGPAGQLVAHWMENLAGTRLGEQALAKAALDPSKLEKMLTDYGPLAPKDASKLEKFLDKSKPLIRKAARGAVQSAKDESN